ncbi:MAG TPA: bifunctional DNA-formamidopyrimidine glycosylase/DNA-(apurinic or apyrimidinic site) lyase [Nevskiaceae bacterium]|nr:bifunctional DNA-formamidopyrimidine glycosylase/DNA-(apurinic or apyrimidinic site) lyase [Nevskiaceae bacterium]
MPELPEVETVRRGLAPRVVGRCIVCVTVRERRLRQPVPADFEARLTGQRIDAIARRGKYLLLSVGTETLLIHLGMSGRLRLLPEAVAPGRHDHVDLALSDGTLLRLHDPRRFGLMLLCHGPPAAHPLLADIGPEPLGTDFSDSYLYARSRGHRVAVKNFIMDSHVVAGVGNIYASEALFIAGIRPTHQARRLSRAQCGRLVWAIRATLEKAIACGGTTLRDFFGVAGQPGYFKQELFVYGRAGAPCRCCETVIVERRVGQRSSFYCPHCQR